MSSLALHGAPPIRQTYLPYGRQSIVDEDIQAVTDVLRSDYLTTGPQIQAFEQEFAAATGATHAVAVNSGTAALHASLTVAGIQPGDEIITTPLTFVATSNAALYLGATPVFADLDPQTLTLAPDTVADRITPRTRAIIAMDYAGHPADLTALRALADQHQLTLIEDACHALGATHRGTPIGSIAHYTCFSLHPVKHITTGEGGIITTHSDEHAAQLRDFRSHGIQRSDELAQKHGSWYYEMTSLGYNYRLPDIGCALGRSQLRRLPHFLDRRRSLAAAYSAALRDSPYLELPITRPHDQHAWHLYPVRLRLDTLTTDRKTIFEALRAENIGVQVHYIPVYHHPWYRQHLPVDPAHYPVTENAYSRLISLPIFPEMTPDDLQDVVHAIHKVCSAYHR